MKPHFKIALIALILLPIAATLTLYPILSGDPEPLLDPADHRGPLHPVTLTEFGDFRCPYCAQFAAYAVPELRKDFINSGVLTYEYRHFPILGDQSTAAAEAAECARDQGRFQDLHDILFDIISSEHADIEFSPANLVELSSLMGMDQDQFRSCLIGRHHQDTVESDKRTAHEWGAKGTPALFIDGKPLPWTTYEDLKTRITSYLETHRTYHE